MDIHFEKTEQNTARTESQRKATHCTVNLPISLEGLRSIIRQKHGSEAAFARKLGYSRSTVSRLLRGKRIPRKHHLIKRIAEILEFDFQQLVLFFERLGSIPIFVTADKLEHISHSPEKNI